MSAIREALRISDRATPTWSAARAELVAMERVVEAARCARSILDEWVLASDDSPEIVARAEEVMGAALAELDGQEEGGPSHAVEPHGGARHACEPSDRAVPPSSCPCRVHGDPDGDCGEDTA